MKRKKGPGAVTSAHRTKKHYRQPLDTAHNSSPPETFQALYDVAAGAVAAQAAAAWPRFGRARIQPLEGGTYRPVAAGQAAVILAVDDRYGEIADLVVWSPDKPSEWWLRFGDECPILGAADLAFAADCHEPVTLLPTPEAWLFSHSKPNSRAVVAVIDWGVDIGPLFEGVTTVSCDSPELRDRFRKALRAWEPKTTSTSSTREVRHAA